MSQVTMTPGKRLTLSEFKNAVEAVQPNKIDLSEVKEYVNAHISVPCICKLCDHRWPAAPMHLMKKKKPTGCPKCKGRNRNSEDFVKLSSDKFGEDAFKLISEFKNMGTPVTLMCQNKHTFIVSPEVHLRTESLGGCKECQAEACSIRKSYTQQQWIEMANGVHKNYYTYERTIYTGSSNKVIITCPEHGDFEQAPTSHLSGCGCPTCGIIAVAQAKRYSEEDKKDIITELTKQYHNQYKYGKIFNDESGKLIIEVICELHDLFPQRLDHHRNGHGCSHCLNKTQCIVTEYLLTLKLNGEDKWLEWNPEWLINPETGYRYRFDNTLHLQKTISELDGLQHFIDGRWNSSNSDKNRSADIYKMKKAVENGYSGFRLFQPHILQNTFDWKQWIYDVLDIIKKSSLPIWVFPDNPIYEEHKKMCEKENIPYRII
jgi:hypothetical protein